MRLVNHSVKPISDDLLNDFCENSGGYEILAEMIAVDSETGNIELPPRTRQHLIQATTASENSIDRRLQEGHNVFGILHRETGAIYDDIGDLERVYRIVSSQFTTQQLREIKMKGWFRPRQPSTEVQHTDVNGGKSGFGDFPDWDEFVNKYINS